MRMLHICQIFYPTYRYQMKWFNVFCYWFDLGFCFVFVGLFWSGVDTIYETGISVNPVLAVIFVEDLGA